MKSDGDLNAIRERIICRAKTFGVFDVYFGYSELQDRYGITVFYETDEQLRTAEIMSFSDRIVAIAVEEIAQSGRGADDTINVAIRSSSDEAVKRLYGGSYFLAMR